MMKIAKCANNFRNSIVAKSQSKRLFSSSLPEQEHEFFFNAGAHMIPHPQKVQTGGDDAYVFAGQSKEFMQDYNMMVLADGVGGNSKRGMDPSKFSRSLVKIARDLYNNEMDNKRDNIKEELKYINNPQELLTRSVCDNNELGTSTCAIVQMCEETGELHTANIGDSGYLWLRKSGIDLILKHQTIPQQVSFNYPYQVGSEGHNPEEAVIQKHEAKHDDIIIMASDGLWDNLHIPQVLDIFRPFVRSMDELDDPGLLAEIIATQALHNSQSSSFFSPFARAAYHANFDYQGGKPDDITVIVAQVRKKLKQPTFELN